MPSAPSSAPTPPAPMRYLLDDEVKLSEGEHENAEERRHGAVRHRRQEVLQRVAHALRPRADARHEALQQQDDDHTSYTRHTHVK